MDSIDAAIFEAWNRLSPRLRKERAEALRRASRMTLSSLRRPIRPSCCCIRVSDTRIEHRAELDPPAYALGHRPHTLRLSAPALRALCAPVRINWPGVRWTIAAQRLGRHCETLRSFITRGVFKVTYEHPNCHDTRGKPVAVVWSPVPLDPNAELGRGPHSFWGSAWLTLHERIPDSASLVTRRTPQFCMYTNRRGNTTRRFRGWKFICPGLGTRCGRETDKLFLPIPLITMHALFADLPETTPDARWACHRCHQLRYFTGVGRCGWNEFITHISAGMLYGHEVRKPEDAAEHRRRKPRKVHRPAPRSELALKLREEGKSLKEIAAAMGLKGPGSAAGFIKAARKRRKTTGPGPGNGA